MYKRLKYIVLVCTCSSLFSHSFNSYEGLNIISPKYVQLALQKRQRQRDLLCINTDM